MKKISNPFIDILPSLDLHGETEDVAIFLLDDFIREQKVLKNKRVVVIHGIGEKILLTAVRKHLATHPDVANYERDVYNGGITIINLQKSV